MISTGTPIYLLAPTATNKRTLLPGKAVQADTETFVGEFEEAAAPAVGADVNVYFEVNGKFFQQGAVVVEVQAPESRSVIGFRRVGGPISAEQRGTYRVSIAGDGVQARIERGRAIVWWWTSAPRAWVSSPPAVIRSARW